MKIAVALLWGLIILGAGMVALWVAIFGEPKSYVRRIK
jgi:hypothetical protein